jgi:hypothetical protein
MTLRQRKQTDSKGQDARRNFVPYPGTGDDKEIEARIWFTKPVRVRLALRDQTYLPARGRLHL